MTILPTKEEIMKTRGRNLTEEQKLLIYKRNGEIANLKKQGFTYIQIAEKFNLSREHIKQICHKQGISGPSKGLGERTTH